MTKNVQGSLWLAAVVANLGVLFFFSSLFFVLSKQHDAAEMWRSTDVVWLVCVFGVPALSLLGLWACRP